MVRSPVDAMIDDTFTYNPETGEIARDGRVVGSRNKGGYLVIKFHGHQMYAHRLAVRLMTGAWPTAEVDHRNRDRSDNRWENIRAARPTDNRVNSVMSRGTVGVRGIDIVDGRYRVRVKRLGVEKTIGTFNDLGDAVAARRAAEKRHYRKFAPIHA